MSNGTDVPAHSDRIRVDLQLIADMIDPGTRVLDIGCGDGELLGYLTRTKRLMVAVLNCPTKGCATASHRACR